MLTLRKGALRLLFLSFLSPLLLSRVSEATPESPLELLAAAQSQNLWVNPTWLALLHLSSGRCFVDDTTFWLSSPRCDPKAEMLALLTALQSEDIVLRERILCAFPARIAFLERALGPIPSKGPAPSCAALEEYKQRAPVDSISLVFAAENITHPMSMMGHVFLRFEGDTQDQQRREHAASFFTSVQFANLPKLLLDSFVLGLPSRFVLLPYSEQLTVYREQQGRNVWEYQLALTEWERTLIHLHVWELRFVESSYYFVGYNCATVIYLTLALAQPALLNELGGWVAPIEVVKAAQRHGMIRDRAFRPSLDWLVRTYEQAIGTAEAARLSRELVGAAQPEDLAKLASEPLKLEFIGSLLERERRAPRLLGDSTERLSALYDTYRAERPPTAVSLENGYDPSATRGLSRLSLGALWTDGAGAVRLEYRPASHALVDTQPNSMAESSLDLGLAAVRFPSIDERPIVEKIHAYAFESLIPHSDLVGGVSSRATIGVEEQRDRQLNSFTASVLSGAVGRTYDLDSELRAFLLGGVGVNHGDGRTALSFGPEFGGILYGIFDTKTVGRYRLVCGEHGSRACYHQIRFEQSTVDTARLTPYATYERVWTAEDHEVRIGVGLRRYF